MKSKCSSGCLKIKTSRLLPGNRYSLFKGYPIIDTNGKSGWIQICFLLEGFHFVQSKALQFNGKNGYYRTILMQAIVHSFSEFCSLVHLEKCCIFLDECTSLYLLDPSSELVINTFSMYWEIKSLDLFSFCNVNRVLHAVRLFHSGFSYPFSLTIAPKESILTQLFILGKISMIYSRCL